MPSDIATVERRHVAGVVTEAGSERGHCAVMLRALNIPASWVSKALTEVLRDGDFMIVDGSAGTVYVNPKREILDEYSQKYKEYQAYSELLSSEVQLPSTTTDNHAVNLHVNISKESEISLAHVQYGRRWSLSHRAEYDGAFVLPRRRRTIPRIQKRGQAMHGKPITIRTMDLGPDKKLSYIKLMHDDNHAFGRRSIRLAMELEEYQMIQLRAILRASEHGKINLLFPFITSIEDIRMAKRMLRLARRQLTEQGHEYDPDMPIGMMVEVPRPCPWMPLLAK